MKKLIRFLVVILLFTPVLPVIALYKWLWDDEASLIDCFTSSVREYLSFFS